MGQANAQYSAVAQVIQQQEGYYPGSLAYVNNNPGNLKYAGQPGATGKDQYGFAIFPTYQAGFQALENQIALNANSGMSIATFTSHYAPAGDGSNNPTAYANTIANAFGLSPSDPLSATASDAVAPTADASIASGDPLADFFSSVNLPDVSDLTGGMDPTTLLIIGVTALLAVAVLKGR